MCVCIYIYLIFYSESNKSLEQRPQRHGRVSITGGSQDVAGQGAR